MSSWPPPPGLGLPARKTRSGGPSLPPDLLPPDRTLPHEIGAPDHGDRPGQGGAAELPERGGTSSPACGRRCSGRASLGVRIRLDQRGLSLSDPGSGSGNPLYPLLSPRVFPPKSAPRGSPVRKPTPHSRLFLPSSMLSHAFRSFGVTPRPLGAPPPRLSPSASLPIRQGESQKGGEKSR